MIEEGALVTVDMGCVVDGYCSDCTRTFAVGEVSERLVEIYGLVAQAQLDGLAAVRAGATGADVDAASRTAISAAGMAEHYGHGLGHGARDGDPRGAGAATRVAPTCSSTRNVVTVEPGLYLPGVGGCRIEDLVVVTEDGLRDPDVVHEGAADRR